MHASLGQSFGVVSIYTDQLEKTEAAPSVKVVTRENKKKDRSKNIYSYLSKYDQLVQLQSYRVSPYSPPLGP
jgi:hypothetical protein